MQCSGTAQCFFTCRYFCLQKQKFDPSTLHIFLLPNRRACILILFKHVFTATGQMVAGKRFKYVFFLHILLNVTLIYKCHIVFYYPVKRLLSLIFSKVHQFKIHTANHPHTRKQIDKKKSWDNKRNFLMFGGHSVAWPRFYEQIRLTFACPLYIFLFFFSFFLSVLTGEMTPRFPPGLLERKREGLNWCNWQKSIKEKKNLEVSAKDNGGNVFALSALWVKSLSFNNVYSVWFSLYNW